MTKNILVIMSDEHTRSVMGAYDNPLVFTPTLDRLADQGVRFENAYTPSPICIPARASFATGLHVHEHHCWSSAEPYYGQVESWMHRLRDKGHDVVSIGKLHHRSADDDDGFSESLQPMYLANGGLGWPQGLQRKPMVEFKEAAELAAELGPGESTYTQYDRDITRACVDWINRSPDLDRPWVLFVSFVSPHFPLTAPEPFYDLYRDMELPRAFAANPSEWIDHPVFDVTRKFWSYNDFFDENSQREALRNYYGLVSFLDANIKQVLDALECTGQSDDTCVIYTSDHGDMIGNHGIWCKSYMYEDSAGIPMIISGPEIPTDVNDTPVSLTDLAATIESALGYSPQSASADWMGRPLQEFISSPEPERRLLSEYHDGGSPCGFYMLRRGDWKLVYFAEGYRPLLFNLAEDPRELRDQAPDNPQVLRKMINELNDILDPEAVNRQAFADQARMIERLGGMDAIMAMKSFNHTPLGG